MRFNYFQMIESNALENLKTVFDINFNRKQNGIMGHFKKYEIMGQ